MALTTLLSKATLRNSHIDYDRPAHQEQFGVSYLAQGHFDMQTKGIKPATFW